jgi:hypothetical protein
MLLYGLSQIGLKGLNEILHLLLSLFDLRYLQQDLIWIASKNMRKLLYIRLYLLILFKLNQQPFRSFCEILQISKNISDNIER